MFKIIEKVNHYDIHIGVCVCHQYSNRKPSFAWA